MHSRAAPRARRRSGPWAPSQFGDILDASSLEAACADCTVVYHVAGANAFCLPDPSPLYRMNVDGTRNVVEAAGRAGVSRIVYTSSAATIGEAKGVLADETTPHRNEFLSHYERSKWEGEIIAFETADRVGVDLVSVNPSSVQGPGRVRGTAKLLIGYLNGTLKALIDSQMSVLDIADCAEGHILAEANGRAGERYILSGATLSVREAIALMGRVAGITDPPRVIPPGAARGVAAVTGKLGQLRRRRAPLCTEMMRTLLHGHAYNGSRATRELGMRYTPIEETLRRTYAWYVANGHVRPRPGMAVPATDD